MNCEAANMPALRQIAFASGSNPREVERMVIELKNKELGASILPDANLQGFATLKNANRDKFLEDLLNAMVEKNKDLVNSFLDGNNISLEKVQNTEWETKLNPLTFTDVRKKFPHKDWNNQALLDNLLHLADRSWILIDGIESGAPKHIYPFRVIDLVASFLEPKKPRMEIFKDYIQCVEFDVFPPRVKIRTN